MWALINCLYNVLFYFISNRYFLGLIFGKGCFINPNVVFIPTNNNQ